MNTSEPRQNPVFRAEPNLWSVWEFCLDFNDYGFWIRPIDVADHFGWKCNTSEGKLRLLFQAGLLHREKFTRKGYFYFVAPITEQPSHRARKCPACARTGSGERPAMGCAGIHLRGCH